MELQTDLRRAGRRWRLDARANFTPAEMAFLRQNASPRDIVAHYPTRSANLAQYIADRAAFGDSGTMDLRSGERRVDYSATRAMRHRLFSALAGSMTKPSVTIADLLDGFSLEGDEEVLRAVTSELRQWASDLKSRIEYHR